jgi:PIN domain nuclease of toxin-antitoxin system
MPFLLDTHTFIWYFNGDPQLSKIALDILDDKTKIKSLSIASLWEIAIKVNAGKLELGYPFNTIEGKLIVNQINVLPVSFRHTDFLINLPLHHRDPFDRMIIAQSIVEDLTVISKDKNFTLYPIKLLW